MNIEPMSALKAASDTSSPTLIRTSTSGRSINYNCPADATGADYAEYMRTVNPNSGLDRENTAEVA